MSGSTRPVAVDLFAGAGGLSLGLEQAGYDVAVAVEYDPIHAAVHEYNFPAAATLACDAAKLSGDQILGRAGGEVHLVAGGPPCQGFSMMGKRMLDDPRNALLGEFVRLVTEIRPRYFVLENVAGLLSGKHRGLIDEAVCELEDGGYRVVSPIRILQAADYGVPQSRRRAIMIGARDDVAAPVYPKPLSQARRIDGVIPASSGLPLGPSVSEAIGDLPIIEGVNALFETDVVEAPDYGPASSYARRLRGVDADPGDFGHRRPAQSLLGGMGRTLHTPTTTERFAATLPGSVEPISRFLRLHPAGICNTLRAGTASDRGAHTAARPIHPQHPRVITVREAARLHSYPDWFGFHVTKWAGMRQIGNSVPPLLGRAIGAAILAADGITSVPGEPSRLGDPRLLEMTMTQAQRHFGIDERIIPARRHS